MREELVRNEMMLEGVISILEGMNPRMLEIKLCSFLEHSEVELKPKAKAEAAGA